MDATEPGVHVVLGAGGGTGGAIVDELLRRGIAARAVTRGPRTDDRPGVEAVTADLAQADAARDAVAGASVVYHAANPPYHQWAQLLPPLNAAVLAAVADAGARLVYADNLYMYGPSADALTESTPQQATDRKGQLRSRLAADLLAAHEAGRAEVVIGRSPDYLGPGGRNSTLGDPLFGPALAGVPVRWIGDPDVPHSVAYLPDMARALVTLGLAEQAAGRAWHLPIAGSPTGRELGAMISAAVGREVKVQGTPRWILRLVGLRRPEASEIADIYYQWNAPFVSSDASFQATFGPQPPTPLDEAVAATAQWFSDNAAQGLDR